MSKKTLFASLLLVFSGYALESSAHTGGHHAEHLRSWHNNTNNKTLKASFLKTEGDNVVLETANHGVVSIPFKNLSQSDQQFATAKINAIKRINQPLAPLNTPKPSKDNSTLFLLLAMSGAGVLIYTSKTPRLSRIALATIGLPMVYVACSPVNEIQPSGTGTPTEKNDVKSLEAAFGLFKGNTTRSDDTYFYVESDGLPEHNMMVGITSWQQQVPIAQAYTGQNAWSIPLQPMLAETPVSTKNNFFRGAIGLAVNGVPIFNALNNRGDDAFLVGELDQWGGHCGRADDYHYHTAPLHLETTTGSDTPIAYALDGFAVYGSQEPDGSAMKALDENNGHFDTQNVYHYHGTPDYPYMIGKMRGEVTKSDSDEITPQPRSTGVREFLQPLNGAEITDFKSTGENAYALEYTVNSEKNYVNYSWDESGSYTFEFVSADGTSNTETYRRR